jgi:hypothetical protein
VTSLAPFLLPLTIAAAWAAAGSAMLPPFLSDALGAICVLALPGLCIERVLSGTPAPDGAAAAPARWLTFSVALIALSGLAVSAVGGHIGELLLSLAAVSVFSAAIPARAFRSPDASERHASRATSDPGDRMACAALIAVVVVATLLAAAAANVARDRMWYLAFVNRLGSGAPIDWSEPFLGTGAIAPRFAYNGWLLALSAWSALTGATPSLVFERLAPPLLTAAVASAAWYFARRMVPAAPGLAALASMATMLATRFPFFSPDRYPFFARIVEDKSAALLVFAPVALGALVDAVDEKPRRSAGRWGALVLCLAAVAFGHALVMLLVGVTISFLFVVIRPTGGVRARRLIAALAVAGVMAVVPGRMAMLARSNIVDSENPSQAWSEDATHPVVRAHLRLERSRDLPLGGPIVEPRLLAHPFLLAGLAGIVVAWRRRHETGAALLAASSIPFLAFAFVPFVAPLFGKLVLPWMAYRALWPIPFGGLAALLITSIPRGMTSGLLRAAAVALFTFTLALLPWNRSSARPDAVSPLRNRDAREVLARIATLPADSRIAAAPGFAELVPALAGRAVVAVSDRGTFVFAGSSAAAVTRLRAAATLVGLAPGSPRFRLAAARRGGATHFVLHGHGCGIVGREVFRSGSLRLCEVRGAGDQERRASVPPTDARVAPVRESTHTMRAALGAGITCMPPPQDERSSKHPAVRGWKRASRWTAKPVTIRCRAKVEPSAADELTLSLAAHLPRARETIILRAVMRTADGRKIVRHAEIPLDGRHASAISLPGTDVRSLQLQLAPAYLPYLNLRELALWERRHVGK